MRLHWFDTLQVFMEPSMGMGGGQQHPEQPDGESAPLPSGEPVSPTFASGGVPPSPPPELEELQAARARPTTSTKGKVRFIG